MKHILIISLSFILILFVQLSVAQSQDDRSSSVLGSMSTPVYVDQVGLQTAQTSSIISQKIDPSIYQLAPYDVISFQFEGNFNLLVKSAVINAQGDVVIPEVGIISLAGKTINEGLISLKDYSKDRFIKTDVSFLTLDAAHPIEVQVIGALEQHFSMKLEGLQRLSTVIQNVINDRERDRINYRENSKITEEKKEIALYAQRLNTLETTLSNSTWLESEEIVSQRIMDGGINLRSIKITSLDGKTRMYDFLRFLRVGKLEDNPTLMSGDVIELTKQSIDFPRVSIGGAVNQFGEFMFKENESLVELIQMGSGYHPMADTSYAIVISESGKKQIDSNDWSSTIVQKGDRVIIPKNEMPSILGTAWVEGEVVLNGGFPIKPNETTIAELINYSGGFKSDALLKGAYIERKGLNQNGVTNKSVYYEEVKRSSDQFLQGLTYMDVLLTLGNDRLSVDLSNEDILTKTVLKDGDRLIIPKDEQTISIIGQVGRPGKYSFRKGADINYYLENAGGITVAGVKNRIFIIKAGSKNWMKPNKTNIESGDMIFVDRTPYEDYLSNQQLQISKSSLTLNQWGLVLSALSTTALIISVIVR